MRAAPAAFSKYDDDSVIAGTETMYEDVDNEEMLGEVIWEATVAEDEPNEVLVNVVNKVLEIVDVISSLSVKPVDVVIVTDVTVEVALDEAVVVIVVHLLSSQWVVVINVVERIVEVEIEAVERVGDVIIVVDTDTDVDGVSGGCNDVTEELEHSVVDVTVVAIVEVITVSVVKVHFSSSQCVVVKVVVDLTTYVDPGAVLVRTEEVEDSAAVSEVVDTTGISDKKVVHLLSSQCVVVSVVMDTVVPLGVPTVELITIGEDDVSIKLTFVDATVVESDVVKIGVAVV